MSNKHSGQVQNDNKDSSLFKITEITNPNIPSSTTNSAKPQETTKTTNNPIENAQSQNASENTNQAANEKENTNQFENENDQSNQENKQNSEEQPNQNPMESINVILDDNIRIADDDANLEIQNLANQLLSDENKAQNETTNSTKNITKTVSSQKHDKQNNNISASSTSRSKTGNEPAKTTRINVDKTSQHKTMSYLTEIRAIPDNLKYNRHIEKRYGIFKSPQKVKNVPKAALSKKDYNARDSVQLDDLTSKLLEGDSGTLKRLRNYRGKVNSDSTSKSGDSKSQSNQNTQQMTNDNSEASLSNQNAPQATNDNSGSDKNEPKEIKENDQIDNNSENKDKTEDQKPEAKQNKTVDMKQITQIIGTTTGTTPKEDNQTTTKGENQIAKEDDQTTKSDTEVKEDTVDNKTAEIKNEDEIENNENKVNVEEEEKDEESDSDAPISIEDLKKSANQLREYEREMINKGDYVQAKNASLTLEMVNKEIYRQQNFEKNRGTVEALVAKRNELQALLNSTTDEWDNIIDNHELNTISKLDQIANQQQEQLKTFDENIPEDLPPLFKRNSVAYLQMRSKEKQLARTRDFDEAIIMQKKANILEKQEEEANFENMDRYYRHKRKKLEERQKHAIGAYLDYASMRRHEILNSKEVAIRGTTNRIKRLDDQIRQECIKRGIKESEINYDIIDEARIEEIKKKENENPFSNKRATTSMCQRNNISHSSSSLSKRSEGGSQTNLSSGSPIKKKAKIKIPNSNRKSAPIQGTTANKPQRTYNQMNVNQLNQLLPEETKNESENNESVDKTTTNVGVTANLPETDNQDQPLTTTG